MQSSQQLDISIHALREESDLKKKREIFHIFYFISIHALREESDELSACLVVDISLFQSTLSVRRATILTI